MKNKFSLHILFMLLILISACNQKHTSVPVADKMVLMEVDRAFSERCAQKGMKEAFIEYIDSNGVLLRPGHQPIIGADAVDFLIQQDDSEYSLTWRPSGAAIASSGDLGYTYGIYALVPAARDTIIYGTYTNIWKKQQDGKWKFALDSGNPGIDEKTD